jgi:hypothetical protein
MKYFFEKRLWIRQKELDLGNDKCVLTIDFSKT